jgi:preprotein translocase subunit YajC
MRAVFQPIQDHWIMTHLAVSTLLLAQEGATQSQSSIFSLVVPMLLIFVVLYFMMIRPQRKQQKERESMIDNIKKNDHVLTNGGFFAIIDKVKEKEFIVKIDEKSDVRMRLAKTAIAGLIKDSGREEKKSEPVKAAK